MFDKGHDDDVAVAYVHAEAAFSSAAEDKKSIFDYLTSKSETKKALWEIKVSRDKIVGKFRRKLLRSIYPVDAAVAAATSVAAAAAAAAAAATAVAAAADASAAP